MLENRRQYLRLKALLKAYNNNSTASKKCSYSNNVHDGSGIYYKIMVIVRLFKREERGLDILVLYA